jgi:excisionase family DNA binding protein
LPEAEGHRLKQKDKRKRLTSEVMYTSVEAAKLLGVTPRTIQIWADNGVLPARKTSGGHRRFPESVLETFLKELDEKSRHGRKNNRPRQPDRYRILVAEDDAFLGSFYEDALKSWNLPLDIRLAKDGYEALICFGIESPNLLIADLKMPRMDGFYMIKAIIDSGHSPDTDIIVVTGLTQEEVDAHGGLPDRVTLFHKPVPFQKLHDFINDKIRERQRATA